MKYSSQKMYTIRLQSYPCTVLELANVPSGKLTTYWGLGVAKVTNANDETLSVEIHAKVDDMLPVRVKSGEKQMLYVPIDAFQSIENELGMKLTDKVDYNTITKRIYNKYNPTNKGAVTKK